MSNNIVAISGNRETSNFNVYKEALLTILSFLVYIKKKSIVFIFMSLYLLIVVLSLANTAYITSKWLDNPLSFISVLHNELGFTYPIFWSFFVVGLIGAGVLEVVRHTLKELYYYSLNRNFFFAVIGVTLFLISYVFLTMTSVENRAKISNQKSMESVFKESENYKSTQKIINQNLTTIKKLEIEKDKYLRAEKGILLKTKDFSKYVSSTSKSKNETWASWKRREQKRKAKLANIKSQNREILRQNKMIATLAKNAKKEKARINKSISFLEAENLKYNKNLDDLLKGYLKEGNKNASIEAMQFKIISIVLELLAIAGFVLKVLHLKTQKGKQNQNNNTSFPTVSHRFHKETGFGGKSELCFYQDKITFFDGESNNKATHIQKTKFYKIILSFTKINDSLNIEVGDFLNTNKQAKNILKSLNGGNGYRGELLTITIKILNFLGFIEQKNQRYILVKDISKIKIWLDESFKNGKYS